MKKNRSLAILLAAAVSAVAGGAALLSAGCQKGVPAAAATPGEVIGAGALRSTENS